MRLNGRSAFISGAGGPMGRAVAMRFAEEGASLALTDISNTRLSGTIEVLRSIMLDRCALVGIRGDVTNAEEAAHIVTTAQNEVSKIDILVNLVGGIKAKQLFEPMLSIDEKRWDETFALNTKGILHLAKLLVPGMIERRYGKIVNIASINFAGERGNSDYGAAKAAVASLTRTMAIEFAPHVNVNCIAPGTIRTSVIDRMPDDERAFYESKPLLKRLGEPVDIANACLFLSSDEASYLTGEIIAVSGGIWPSL